MEAEERGHADGQEGCPTITTDERQHDGHAHVDACRPPNGVKHCGIDDGEVNGRVDEQEVEILIIPEADAVVDPWAVVVHTQDTHVADSTVVAPVRLVFQAPLAMPPLATVLGLDHGNASFLTFPILSFCPQVPGSSVRDAPRVSEHAPAETVEEKAREYVKDCHLDVGAVHIVHPAHAGRHVELKEPQAVHVDVQHIEEGDGRHNHSHLQQLAQLAEARARAVMEGVGVVTVVACGRVHGYGAVEQPR
mmetsp:Transcript_73915/g.165468  ORF Transcript_73915/g.165468 Transcript_73915/m.165468 type:complete len:249 (+) Transcript_73915:296-1042(+)